jgi:hypothetical protein
VVIDFEGAPLEAREGESVAAAVLAAGHAVTRTTPVSGAGRGPFCMMGMCFDCLMEIDGVANIQACMVAVQEGQKVRRMAGARPITGERGDD